MALLINSVILIQIIGEGLKGRHNYNMEGLCSDLQYKSKSSVVTTKQEYS